MSLNNEAAAACTIETCSIERLEDWVALRTELWPDGSVDEHRQFAIASLNEPTRLVSFVARDNERRAWGFAEASLRFDYVNGCSSSPVGFLEGLFVREDARRNGLGRGLVAAVEFWARERGCTELVSDALLKSETSHGAHRGIGFAETERVVYFRKSLEILVPQ